MTVRVIRRVLYKSFIEASSGAQLVWWKTLKMPYEAKGVLSAEHWPGTSIPRRRESTGGQLAQTRPRGKLLASRVITALIVIVSS